MRVELKPRMVSVAARAAVGVVVLEADARDHVDRVEDVWPGLLREIISWVRTVLALGVSGVWTPPTSLAGCR